MSDQNDDSLNYALIVLAAVVGLVIAGVLALAISTTMRAKTGEKPATLPVTAAAMAEADGQVYFASGSVALPPEAAEVLVRVADTARANPAKSVQISGFHDASGDPVQNAELAKQRALAVRAALEANGVAPDRLVLEKPIVSTGDGDAREARRVELRLR